MLGPGVVPTPGGVADACKTGAPTQSVRHRISGSRDGAGVGHDIGSPGPAPGVRGLDRGRRGPGRAVVHGTRRAAQRGDSALRGPQAAVAVRLPRTGVRSRRLRLGARRFTRIDPLRPPKRSALQRCIRAVRAETWERINRALLGTAKDDGIEAGRKVRIDSTVTETHILEPSDSQLLYDAVRVLSRLLARGREKLGPDAFPFHDHRRAAKRKKWKIPKARMKRKVKLYRELLAVVRRTLRYTDGALAAVEGREEPWLDDWRTQVAHYRDLAGMVVRQTVRRVLRGETVPAGEKVVSLFEPHTDIIRKGGRRVQYGHNVNLGSGASGLVFDAVVEAGNPADSSRCLPMIERHAAIYGSMPEQVACDGGYASKANLAEAKALGVHDMVFHKKKGLKATDMASSPRVYRRLRNFRAGMEAVVSYLKRCFGLRRCNWRGLAQFRAFVWSAVVTHNLWVIARHKLKLKPA